MANGVNGGSLAGDMWRDLPAWLKVAMQLGAPTVAAGWLIYMLSTSVAADIRDLKVSVMQHVISTDAMMQRLNEQSATRGSKMDNLVRIAQTQCVNATTDALQRRDCVNAVK